MKICGLETRRIMADLCFLYRIVAGHCSIPFDSMFKYVDHGHGTRGHSKKLDGPKSQLLCRQNFFSHRVVNFWNSLSEDVVSSPSLNSFKRKLESVDFSKFLQGSYAQY